MCLVLWCPTNSHQTCPYKLMKPNTIAQLSHHCLSSGHNVITELGNGIPALDNVTLTLSNDIASLDNDFPALSHVTLELGNDNPALVNDNQVLGNVIPTLGTDNLPALGNDIPVPDKIILTLEKINTVVNSNRKGLQIVHYCIQCVHGHAFVISQVLLA